MVAEKEKRKEGDVKGEVGEEVEEKEGRVVVVVEKEDVGEAKVEEEKEKKWEEERERHCQMYYEVK